MIGVQVVSRDAVSSWLARMSSAIDGAQLKEVVGRAGANTIRNHLFKINSARPNKLGGKRTKFYAQAARSTQHKAVDDGAVVSVNHVGIAQRYFGGTIRPRRSKYLTLPAVPRAYGKRAREIPGLKFVPFKKRAALVKDDTVFYWLVRSVTQQADSSVLPENSEMAAHTAKAASAYTDRIMERMQGKLLGKLLKGF